MSLDVVMNKIKEDIERVGFSIIATTTGEGGFTFAYTVGLSLQGHPEVLLKGLPPAIMHDLLHNYYDLIQKKGTPAVNAEVQGILGGGLSVIMCELPDNVYDDYLIQAGNFFGWENKFKALGMIWPDAEGLFPHEEGFDIKGLPEGNQFLADYIAPEEILRVLAANEIN